METVTVRVSAYREIARGVREIDLRRSDGGLLPTWSAGAHIDIRLPDGMVRQYSLCGIPGEQEVYRIAVLAERPGRGGSQFIHQALRMGDELPLLEVRNTFPLVRAQRHVLIAGGIGLTPILSMVRTLEATGEEWELHYGGRSREEMAYFDEVATWAQRATLYPEAEVGRLPLPDILGTCRDGSTTIYACGPPGMLTALQQLVAGDELIDLRLERFSGSGEHDSNTEFTVVLAGSGLRIRVPPSVSLLEAMEEAGVDIMSSCRSGICGTCEIGVLAGTPDHRDSVLTDEEKFAGGSILPCVSRSCTAVLELDI